MRSAMAFAWIWVAAWCLPGAALAQEDESEPSSESEAAGTDEADATPKAEPAPAPEEPAAPPKGAPEWWVGAYLQGNIVPSFMLKLFLDDAPTVANFAFGVTMTHRSQDGMSIVFGLGYASYAFDGPFRIKGDPDTDTEYLNSTLGLLHLRGQLLWSTDIVPNTLSFEYGVGLDLGVVLGSMIRTEAYRDASGVAHPCNGPLNPNPIYCELPVNVAAGTDAYNQHGAQYHVVEKRVPPVALVPMLPVLALRYTPIRQVALKLDFAFGLMQFALGLSAQYGLE